jgi:excisionase family DNA binding protein
MAAGQGVFIVPAHAELTTQQAADLTNVSRPFLIGLLSAGEIDYRTVGQHRRIKAESLMDYIAADDRKRREAADELTQLNQVIGLGCRGVRGPVRRARLPPPVPQEAD